MTSGVGEDPGQPGHLDRDSAFFDDFAFRGAVAAVSPSSTPRAGSSQFPLSQHSRGERALVSASPGEHSRPMPRWAWLLVVLTVLLVRWLARKRRA
jgi:hypothetical protein